MSRTKEFIQQIEVTPGFLEAYPRFVDDVLRTLADENTEAVGPRGGRYRLLPAQVKWNMQESWDGQLTFWTRRLGRYVRPYKPLDSDSEAYTPAN